MKKEIVSLIQTLRYFSKDIGIEFLIDKCTVLVLIRRRVVNIEWC